MYKYSIVQCTRTSQRSVVVSESGILLLEGVRPLELSHLVRSHS